MTRRCIKIWIGLFKIDLCQKLICHKFMSNFIHNDTPQKSFFACSSPINYSEILGYSGQPDEVFFDPGIKA